MSNVNGPEKKKDLLIDSVISQSRNVEERELERWAPDGDDSDCLELETMSGGRKWSRSVNIESIFTPIVRFCMNEVTLVFDCTFIE
jgi:hypothetical protein